MKKRVTIALILLAFGSAAFAGGVASWRNGNHRREPLCALKLPPEKDGYNGLGLIRV